MINPSTRMNEYLLSILCVCSIGVYSILVNFTKLIEMWLLYWCAFRHNVFITSHYTLYIILFIIYIKHSNRTVALKFPESMLPQILRIPDVCFEYHCMCNN